MFLFLFFLIVYFFSFLGAIKCFRNKKHIIGILSLIIPTLGIYFLFIDFNDKYKDEKLILKKRKNYNGLISNNYNVIENYNDSEENKFLELLKVYFQKNLKS
jgi:cadmium resistance protein CadD (predicted permease)